MNIIDIIFLVIIALVAIAGLITGFMKNGLNNLATVGTIALAAVFAPMIGKKLSSASFMAWLPSALSFVKNEATRDKVAFWIITVVAAILLLAVFGLLMFLLKKLLRKIIRPKRKLWKWMDRIFGMVFGVALYGCIMLFVIGAVCTIPSVKKSAENSFVQKNNFFAEFCEKNLNIGNMFGSGSDEDENEESAAGALRIEVDGEVYAVAVPTK